jgi:hypothetical protein
MSPRASRASRSSSTTPNGLPFCGAGGAGVYNFGCSPDGNPRATDSLQPNFYGAFPYRQNFPPPFNTGYTLPPDAEALAAAQLAAVGAAVPLNFSVTVPPYSPHTHDAATYVPPPLATNPQHASFCARFGLVDHVAAKIASLGAAGLLAPPSVAAAAAAGAPSNPDAIDLNDDDE